MDNEVKTKSAIINRFSISAPVNCIFLAFVRGELRVGALKNSFSAA